MALGLKKNNQDSKVYVVMGDGEITEGSNWEAAAAAARYRLDNLIVESMIQKKGKPKVIIAYTIIGKGI